MSDPLIARGLTLIANPAATMDEGWRAILLRQMDHGHGSRSAPVRDDKDTDSVTMIDSLWGTPALSRLIFRTQDFPWPRGDPFASACGRALLLDGRETRLFTTYLGLACHRDWYANLIDGRLSRRIESAYDDGALAFLGEGESPFAIPVMLHWRSVEHTLALGLQFWEHLLRGLDEGWRVRLRFKLPPDLPQSESPPRLADPDWPERLLQRLFPQCHWLQS
ncbi:MAG: hypothetical protein OD811_01495 [Alphaproteobacteria bacterium]